MHEVTVVGAGVVGLTTAVLLEEAGHRVHVVSAERPERTTSAAAGAVWYPFAVGPPEAVNRWARATRAWLLELCRTVPEAGVDVLTVRECAADARPPWWAEAIDGIRLVEGPQPSGASLAWEFEAPRVEPALHLRWLESRLDRPIEMGRVDRLDDVPGDAVVNCTGIGARRLTGDTTLRALLGQTVLVEPGDVDLRRMYGDERDLSRMFYVIPRRAEVVIGGLRARPGAPGSGGAPAGPSRGAGRTRGPDHSPLWARRRGLHPRPRLGRGRGRTRRSLSFSRRRATRAVPCRR
jgi:D-amino-acid oxidase